jgi:histone H3
VSEEDREQFWASVFARTHRPAPPAQRAAPATPCEAPVPILEGEVIAYGYAASSSTTEGAEGAQVTEQAAAVTPVSIVGRRPRLVGRARRRVRPGARALREICTLQRSVGLLVPRASFARVVRELAAFTELVETDASTLRWTVASIAALQEVAELHVVQLFEDAQLCALHARRVTVQQLDVQLARRLGGRP